MTRPMKQLPIRFPADVKAWIEEQAAINGSSQNSEVIRALRAAMARDGADFDRAVDGSARSISESVA